MNRTNFSNTTASVVARFLSDLHLVHKLSYNLILLHKSVVATLCDPEKLGYLASHVLIKHILKSIALRKPVNHDKPPVWNINTLASYFEKYRIDKIMCSSSEAYFFV